MRMFVLLALAALFVPGRAAGVSTTHAAAGTVGALPAVSGQAVRYVLPVPAPAVVVAPFHAPTTRYGPGHRGVDLATPRAGPVRAAADAVVSFAGDVAGRGVVVLDHPDGLTTEYEPLHPVVRAGQSVRAGAPLGTVSGTHGTCAPDQCVHWAARRGDVYLDPMTLPAPLGRVRLLPWST